ncbi:MAG: outer membrane protein assembly factor BamE [Deltaproteobacteria bacterium]|nr:outer membrane protein assembly factor BamE [Deltaproteobacteria bacterium]
MRPWLKIAVVLVVWLAVAACVSTGAREITQPATTGRLETGKSTKAEVTAVLGFPASVTYGRKGEETWDYYYVTEYPQAIDFVPVAAALSDGFNQTTRALMVSFDRQGLVQNLQKSRTTGKAEIYPY